MGITVLMIHVHVFIVCASNRATTPSGNQSVCLCASLCTDARRSFLPPYIRQRKARSSVLFDAIVAGAATRYKNSPRSTPRICCRRSMFSSLMSVDSRARLQADVFVFIIVIAFVVSKIELTQDALMSPSNSTSIEGIEPVELKGVILEAWDQGLVIGSLLVMLAVTVANMRKRVLLHKLILTEVFTILYACLRTSIQN